MLLQMYQKSNKAYLSVAICVISGTTHIRLVCILWDFSVPFLNNGLIECIHRMVFFAWTFVYKITSNNSLLSLHWEILVAIQCAVWSLEHYFLTVLGSHTLCKPVQNFAGISMVLKSIFYTYSQLWSNFLNICRTVCCIHFDTRSNESDRSTPICSNSWP